MESQSAVVFCIIESVVLTTSLCLYHIARSEKLKRIQSMSPESFLTKSNSFNLIQFKISTDQSFSDIR